METFFLTSISRNVFYPPFMHKEVREEGRKWREGGRKGAVPVSVSQLEKAFAP